MPTQLYHGDNLDILPQIEDDSVDSVITDSPYGLKFMGKEWDYGVPGVKYWAECLRVSKPGASLVAFGGTRTHHRLMCAIEDAGWEIRDVVMWLYGSGFPKSHDISKAIDKAAGAEREVVGVAADFALDGAKRKTDGSHTRPTNQVPNGDRWSQPITSPATDAAALWTGWGTALKPAYEPIILAMKPRRGTFAQNALDYGVAGVWVDGCRVGTNGSDDYGRSAANANGTINAHDGFDGKAFKIAERAGEYASPQGRWPANLVLSHTPECRQVGVRKVKGSNGRRGSLSNAGEYQDGVGNWGTRNTGEVVGYASPDGTETIPAWECAPGCPVAMLDAQSGERRNGGQNATSTKGNGMFMSGDMTKGISRFAGDTGGASRFFYTAKASRKERELGLLGHIPCLKCGELDSETHFVFRDGEPVVRDGKLVEEKCRRNGHPTVKPLSLMRWLCRLTATPTGGVVLDPFLGSGTTGMATVMEGRDFIGIEIERPSYEVATHRIAWAEAQVPQAVQLALEGT